MTHAPQPIVPSSIIPDAPERVVRGLLASLGAIVAGVVLTVAIWRAGFIAGISSFVLAAGAMFLYTKVAGRPPRRGLPALIVLIVLGVALSFFAVVASDLSQFYDDAVASGGSVAITKAEFIRQGLLDGDVLSTYGKDAALFVVFAGLGVFSTMRRMVAASRR